MKKLDHKITENIVNEYKNKISIKDIANHYNICTTTVIKYLNIAGC